MASGASPFLDGVPLRRVSLPDGSPLCPAGLALGQGTSAIELLITASTVSPAAVTLRTAWKARNAGRAAPLLLVVLHGEGRASLCGPAGDDPPAYLDLDRGQVERLCREALERPDRHAALRALRDILPSLGSDLCGLRNEGFLAIHELRTGARERADWRDCGRKAAGILVQRGADLLLSLGFQIERHDNVTSVLRARDRKIAVAVLLQRDESPELQGERFGALSPITHALAVADRENLPWVIIQHGAKIRVYPSKVGLGIGRRGRTETYIECHTGLLPDTDAAYLWLLCSADALVPGGTLEQLLEESGRFAGDLARSLRERIYESVVPKLAAGIVAARNLRRPTPQDLAETYEMALTVLFRLLFIAYAEDKDLLPFRWNGLYQRRSLKTKAKELADLARAGGEFDAGDSLWGEIGRLFRSVDKGNREWGVPAYDGGLFADEAGMSLVGARLAALSLPNTILGPALRDLLLVNGPDGLGPVDFRSLGVREFGTIYEGLLESELSLAQTDLVVDKSGNYRPTKGRETPVVRKGEVYLHNASGARKSTGSYFTKQFAVEHLLERALDPALDEHLSRLDALDDDRAGESFFDFRVADLAMGSGHFLVAAIDHVERKLTGYLARRRLHAVAAELGTLRQAALTALGPLADQVEIEDSQLLRRLIARRCVYGVDINVISVQLARLSIWIHTFVPGLPLSLLDHSLVQGNSLLGIGRLEELNDTVHSFFQFDAAVLLGDARAPLERLARLADVTPADLTRARDALSEASRAIGATYALCDMATAARLDGGRLDLDLTRWATVKETLLNSRAHRNALKRLAGLDATHLPLAFPEVFLRSRPGFDVIVGNPPWDKIRFEVDSFFCRYIPGLNALPQAERKTAIAAFLETHPAHADLRRLSEERAQALQLAFSKAAGAFRHQGAGHLDTAKLFVERFVHLVAHDGHIGVVLPRQCLVLSGWSELREVLFAGRDTTIAQLRNRNGWIFPDAEGRYVIALISAGPKTEADPSVSILPGASTPESYEISMSQGPVRWALEYLRHHVCEDLRIPLIAQPGEEQLLVRLMGYPRLGSPGAGHYQSTPFAVLDVGRDLPEVGTDPDGTFVSRTRSVGAFSYEYDADSRRVSPTGLHHFLTRKLAGCEIAREDAAVLARSPHRSTSLAYRYPSRNDDSRTLIATMLPGDACAAVGYVHCLLTPRASDQQRLCLLSLMNSIAWDWIARRFVDRHVTAPILRLLPVPVAGLPVQESELVSLALGLLSQSMPEVAAELAESTGVLRRDGNRSDLLLQIDVLVAQLLHLSQDDMSLMLADFSDGAVAPEYRVELLRLLGAGVPQ